MWLISNKVRVEDSGILSDFRDCHCHLLPGVDDGVKKIDETLRILECWEKQGMKEVWLTPHVMEDFPNKTEHLKGNYERLKTAYKGNISLHLAAENMLDNVFMDRLAQGDLLTIGRNKVHLLVETSYYNPPMDMDGVLDNIRKQGYIPILAHPERYQYMTMSDYKKWKQQGVLFQLNVPSLVGAYGPEVQCKAEQLLEREMYDYCGTDTHSIHFVNYFLKGKISKKIVKKVNRIAEAQQL